MEVILGGRRRRILVLEVVEEQAILELVETRNVSFPSSRVAFGALFSSPKPSIWRQSATNFSSDLD